MKLSGIPSTEILAVNGIYTIDGEGSVNLPQIGRVNIAGLTPGAAESTIENVYKSQEIYTNPNVVITTQAQSRFVNVDKLQQTQQNADLASDRSATKPQPQRCGIGVWACRRNANLFCYIVRARRKIYRVIT
jgi:hypothetical protein